MSRNDGDPSINRIVPDRGDLPNRSGRRGARTTRSPEMSTESRGSRTPGRSSGGVRVLLTVLTVGLILTACGGYYFYVENNLLKEELESASGRLQSLENRLSVVGESSEDTFVTVNETLEFHFSEIDKLWAARNENRVNISTNKTSLDALETATEQLETMLNDEIARLDQTTAQLVSMQVDIDTITGNIAGLTEFADRLNALGDDVAQIRNNLATMQGLSSRMGIAEQDIESIYAFRLQVNQDINTFREQIQELQRRVSEP